MEFVSRTSRVVIALWVCVGTHAHEAIANGVYASHLYAHHVDELHSGESTRDLVSETPSLNSDDHHHHEAPHAHTVLAIYAGSPLRELKPNLVAAHLAMIDSIQPDTSHIAIEHTVLQPIEPPSLRNGCSRAPPSA